MSNGSEHGHTAPWYKTMCLTGVDYFSMLGFQPGIALLAAGALGPLATLGVVFLTLFGALPIYRRVAERSPNGQGSIAMLEALMPGWVGKLVVLGLIGFCATDFIITITLSAADAAAHIVQNPYVPQMLSNQIVVTLLLVLALGAMFLKGMKEVVGLAVILVVVYLGLNAAVLIAAIAEVAKHPQVPFDWANALTAQHGGWTGCILAAALVFPKLALGFSGFETGVTVMPHVQGDASDTHANPAGRIRNTKKLLAWSAMIMGVFLIPCSFITVWLVPIELVKAGGEAEGRAISYLAHKLLGHGFGTAYDISSVFILWFAGASAMAGLINLVPRYLPRYGMAPEWAKANRPLVIFFTLVSIGVTLLFRANVEAQGGAYATGVLVLITSAALAVTLTSKGVARLFFGAITAVFIYTTVVNVFERPDGLKVASFFIGAILVTSLLSRWRRSTELRHTAVHLDSDAKRAIEQAIEAATALQCSRHSGEPHELPKPQLRLLAHRPGGCSKSKLRDMYALHGLSSENVLLLEVSIDDPSNFEGRVLHVTCCTDGNHQVLRCTSAAAANAVAQLLLHIQESYAYLGVQVHAFFGWSEKNPVGAAIDYLLFGQGEVAMTARNILQREHRDSATRPRIHVG